MFTSVITVKVFKDNSNSNIFLNSKSWSELTDINTWKESMPESLKAQVLVKAQFEDPEIQMKNQEITKTKTVQELSQINSLAEFPIPKTIETLLEKKITLEKSRLENYVKLHYIFILRVFIFVKKKLLTFDFAKFFASICGKFIFQIKTRYISLKYIYIF